ncbi:MAG: lytic transglycosylase domain-containing protein [Deltaproteobacteria bacterium]|nr:lytic transglycosylase domain-containing protein [Deltaproteobacteria bacterium]
MASMEDIELQAGFTAHARILRPAAAVFLLAVSIYAGVLLSQGSERAGTAIAAYVHDVVASSRTGLGATEEARLAQVIVGESEAHNLDPLFILALIKTESEFNNWSRSSKGALGLMQIMPSTGRELAGALSLDWRGEATLLDPYTNVKIGVYYFNTLKSRYNHDTKLSLAAYNAGPRRVRELMQSGSPVGEAFSARVLAHYNEMKERSEAYANERKF